MKNMKWVSAILAVVMMIGMFAGAVLATVAGPGDIEVNANGGQLSGITGTILGFIKYAAFAIAIGMLIFIGIKYMMSGAGEKAEVKKTLLPFLVGAILVGGASAIAEWAIDMGGAIQ